MGISMIRGANCAGQPSDGAWCILRTSGRHTIALMESLKTAGFDAWTPIETKTVRVPRANARREVRLPIMPSYVFAKAGHLIDLIMLADARVKPRRGAVPREAAHAAFSVMHFSGKIPLVSERHFAELRKIEARRTPLKKADKALPVGIGVKIKAGSFGGLEGIVERSDRAHTVVCFNGRFTVKVATSLIDLEALYDRQSATDNAAQEAA